jgi:molecular chaperone GrpE
VARKKNKDSAAEAAVEELSEIVIDATVEDPEAAAGNDLASELATSQAAVAENRDLYLRALADLENYRKRALRDREDAIRFANDNLLREILPVLDNLERALEHAGDEAEQKVLREGVEMTLSQLRKVLESAGVTKVTADGVAFDPNFHQAMGQVETGDQPVNTVVQVLQHGYLLRERLLRPAMVLIAKAPSAAADNTAS